MIFTAILKIPDIFHVLEPQTRQSRLETINIPIGLLMVSRGRPGRAGFHPNMQLLVIFHEIPLENKKISETTIDSPPFGEMGALPRPPLRILTEPMECYRFWDVIFTPNREMSTFCAFSLISTHSPNIIKL